jgi:hypothetical protein
MDVHDKQTLDVTSVGCRNAHGSEIDKGIAHSTEYVHLRLVNEIFFFRCSDLAFSTQTGHASNPERR